MTTVATTKAVMLPIASVIVDPDIQSRFRIDPARVSEYTSRYKEGGPNAVGDLDAFVNPDNGEIVLANGFTRTESAIKAELTELPYILREGDRRAAALFSLSANLGAPATDEDRRFAAKKALLDLEWGSWSDRKIAELTGYSHTSVGKLRAALAASGALSRVDSSKRTFERGGQQYEMDTHNIGGRPASVGSAKGPVPEAQDDPPPDEPVRRVENQLLTEGDKVVTRAGRIGVVTSIVGAHVMVETPSGTQRHHADTLRRLPEKAVNPDETDSPDEVATNDALSPSPDDPGALTDEERKALEFLCKWKGWVETRNLRYMKHFVPRLVELELLLEIPRGDTAYVFPTPEGFQALGFEVIHPQPLEDFLNGKPAAHVNESDKWVRDQQQREREQRDAAQDAAAAERDTPGARMREKLRKVGFETCWLVIAHKDKSFTAVFDRNTHTNHRAASSASWEYARRILECGAVILENGSDIDKHRWLTNQPMVRFKMKRRDFEVLTAKKSVEYYTPSECIELARQVLPSIDLDPASCDLAQSVVQAAAYLTKEDNGLSQPWYGNVWLNPPYGTDEKGEGNQGKWLTYLDDQFTNGAVESAIALVKAAVGETWFFDQVWDRYAFCVVKGRIRFLIDVNGKLVRMKSGIPGGNAYVLYSTDLAQIEQFKRIFDGKVGKVILPDSVRDAFERQEVLNVAAAS